MPTIIPNQDFKHDREQYKKGESYEVAPELSYYFKMCGWTEGAEPQGEQVHELEIHDSAVGHEAEVK